MDNAELDPQADVIAFLSSGAAFGGVPVERVETHTAIVFVAGDRAYKLKKNIRYSYLDYSSVELRRSSCEAELTINRRFAPTLYLGVERVSRTKSGALVLGDDGPVVDWLVVMRRFDQDAQFDRMAARGQLPLELMVPLADRIAEVHRKADTSTEYGGGDGLRKAIDITIENLRLAARHGLPSKDVELWSNRIVAALDRLTPFLNWRRSTGHVRACHGDLHLQNICMFEGLPTLFDAIEFDPALSCTDVLYDLAFLLMDLEHRGLASHASRIFNRYLDRCEELEGVMALPLFMSVRAGIRAQISIAAAQHRHDATRVQSFVDQAKSYLSLAQSLLEPKPARLVAVGGASGAGKTTLAQNIAPLLWGPPGARVLRSDVLRKRIAMVSPETPLSADHYTADRSHETYERLLTETRHCLEGGCSVVVDAVFAKRAERDAFAAVARVAGVPFQGLWLEAPLNVLKTRIDGRRGDASDATPDIAEKQLGWIEDVSDWRHIDARGAPDDVAARALRELA